MRQDRTGIRYGRLTVIGMSARTNGKRTYWDCICECGQKIAARSDALSKGATRSCGCFQREVAKVTAGRNATHRMTETREYETWQRMLQRCDNPRHPDYEDYGERGITVCLEWANSFSAFYSDMGPRPEGMTLERADVNKGYDPDNCIWADQYRQQRNRRHSLYVNFEQGLIPLAEYAERSGLSYSCVYGRVKTGTLIASRPNSE